MLELEQKILELLNGKTERPANRVTSFLNDDMITDNLLTNLMMVGEQNVGVYRCNFILSKYDYLLMNVFIYFFLFIIIIIHL